MNVTPTGWTSDKLGGSRREPDSDWGAQMGERQTRRERCWMQWLDGSDRGSWGSRRIRCAGNGLDGGRGGCRNNNNWLEIRSRGEAWEPQGSLGLTYLKLGRHGGLPSPDAPRDRFRNCNLLRTEYGGPHLHVFTSSFAQDRLSSTPRLWCDQYHARLRG